MSFEQSLQVLNIELNNNKITDNDVKRAKEVEIILYFYSHVEL